MNELDELFAKVGIDREDEVTAMPDFIFSEVSEEPEYFSLEQHPKAKEIYKSFTPDTKVANSTLGEFEHFRNIYPDVGMHLFFDGGTPTSFDYYYDGIEHNIRSYTLWKLAEENKIGLFAYNATAALS